MTEDGDIIAYGPDVDFPEAPFTCNVKIEGGLIRSFLLRSATREGKGSEMTKLRIGDNKWREGRESKCIACGDVMTS